MQSEAGPLIPDPEEQRHPGVAMCIHFDAIGQPTAFACISPFLPSFPWGGGGGNVLVCGVYAQEGQSLAHGVGESRPPDLTTHIDSSALMTTVSGGNAEADDAGEGQNNTDAGDCCYRSHSPNIATDTAQVCENTAGIHNNNRGQVYEYPPGIMLGFTEGGENSKWHLKPRRGGNEQVEKEELEEWRREKVRSGEGFACGKGGITKDEALDGAIFVLDILGFVPAAGALADGLAAVLELSKDEADYLAAALSGLSAALSVILPVAGDAAAKAVKWTWKGAKKLRVNELKKVVQEALDKAAEMCGDAAKAAWKELKDWWTKFEEAVNKYVRPDQMDGDFVLAGAGGPNVGGKSVVHQTGNAAGGAKASDAAGNGKPASGSSTGAPAVQKGPIPDQAPSNLAEQLALKEAKANGGETIMENLSDAPRLIANWGNGEWVKKSFVHKGADGTQVEIHWFHNKTTGQNVEYKFK